MQQEPVQGRLQQVIREYAELRLALTRRPPDGASLERALKRIQKMHGRMTELVAEAVRDGTSIAVPLTNTLNGVTSNHAARLAAVKDRLPSSIVGLLFLAGVVATMLVGRQQEASSTPQLAGTLSFVLLVTMVVYLTLDLNQPYRGLIRVSQEPMERVLSSMAR